MSTEYGVGYSKVLALLGDDAVPGEHEVLARCIFHDEERPSLKVSFPTKQFKSGSYYCFGCHKSGNMQALLMRLGLSPTRASMLLNALRVSGELQEEEISKYSCTDAPPNTGNTEIITHTRGIDAATIEWADLRVNLSLQSIIIPVKDFDGSMVGWIGRRFGPGENRFFGAKGFSPHDYLYGSSWVMPAVAPVVLIESALDAILLHQYGVPAVATFGTGITKRQVELLRKFKCVIIVPDNDKPGMEMAAYLEKELGDSVLLYQLDPEYKDVGELPIFLLKTIVEELKEDYFTKTVGCG